MGFGEAGDSIFGSALRYAPSMSGSELKAFIGAHQILAGLSVYPLILSIGMRDETHGGLRLVGLHILDDGQGEVRQFTSGQTPPPCLLLPCCRAQSQRFKDKHNDQEPEE